MITWDGLLAAQARRAEYARLGFPLRLITTAASKHLTPAPGGRSAALLPFAADEGTAAGTPTPHRSTGSHHNDDGGVAVAYLLNAACFASALIVSIGAIVHHHGAGFIAFDWACVGGCFTLLVLMICIDVMGHRDQKRQQKALLDEIARSLVSKADLFRAWTGEQR